MGDPGAAMLDFGVLRLRDPLDHALALSVWERCRHQDPHAHPTYVELFARLAGAEPLCAVGVWPAGSVMMPFCLRTVPGSPDGGSTDAITPYGFGGAYASGDVRPEHFWSKWQAWAIQTGLVSFVIRRNVTSEAVLAPFGRANHVMDNVVIELGQGPDAAWRGFEGRARTDCRRAEQAGVTVVLDDSCEHLEQFHRLYIQTMVQRHASPFYMFSVEDLAGLHEQMPKSVWLVCAYLGPELIASEMYLVGADVAYYFLSGSSPTARQVRAHHLIKARICGWLHERGVSSLALGGGMRANDSLFRHKRSFARGGVVPFEVEYQEFRSDRVQDLMAARTAAEPHFTPDPTYYPAYRAPSQP